MQIAVQQAMQEENQRAHAEICRLGQVVMRKDGIIEILKSSGRSKSAKLAELEEKLALAEAEAIKSQASIDAVYQKLADAEDNRMIQAVVVVELRKQVQQMMAERAEQHKPAEEVIAGNSDDCRVRALETKVKVLKAELRRKRKQCKALRERLCSQEEDEYADDPDESDKSGTEPSDGEGCDEVDDVDVEELIDSPSDDSADDSSFDGDALMESAKKKKEEEDDHEEEEEPEDGTQADAMEESANEAAEAEDEQGAESDSVEVLDDIAKK